MRSAGPDITEEKRAEILEVTDFKVMEAVRARVDATVKDKATAEALKPWYNRACKRPCFHDEYLPTFNRPNVKLVDTDGKGVDRITENSLVVAGSEYQVDCIIYATGFDLSAYTGITIPVYGRNGTLLSEKWKDGAITLHGIQSHGFPNLFILSTIQSAWDANFPHMMEEQSRHIAYIIEQARARGSKTIEATEEAENEWLGVHEKFSEYMLRIWRNCTPSYFNNEGQPSAIIARNGGFGAGVPAFVEILSKWREEGSMQGVKLGDR
jgi:cyclohexanone monooxygenase